MDNKEKFKKISLICDLYIENKTTIDENKYIELINNNKEYLNKKIYSIKEIEELAYFSEKHHKSFVYKE